MVKRIGIALVCGGLAWTLSCSKDASETCAGYCQSELECGMIGRAGVAPCLAACQQRITAADTDCGPAFRRYADCYDASASCMADDCFEDFVRFAEACGWHEQEVGLSMSRTAQGPRTSPEDPS